MPVRLDQALTSRKIRKWRVERQRSRTVQSARSVTETPRRLFIDLAVISKHDAGTGIQRVVRALALALTRQAPADWEIRFVAADRRKAYHNISWPEPGLIVDAGALLTARPGDVFLGLDFALDTTRRYRGQLAEFRRQGGQLWFLVCDLLPAERPEWFSPNNVIRYKAWLEIIAGISDGFLCISDQTEADLRRVLDQHYGVVDGYRTCVVPMGYSIKESVLRDPAPGSSAAPPRLNVSFPFSLMVGTLEPRKGHADVLNAFDELWRQGMDHRLVLVGRQGWHTQDLRNVIRTHPEHGGKLIWLDDVEDAELERIYEACEGVIIGSHAEGFGLPLIEALGHDKPVLARDLPIFRAHEKLGVRYFPASASPQILAQCIRKWSEEIRVGGISVKRPSTGWQESTRTVLAAVTSTGQ
nr:glycosyltransferase family 1 protein [Sphingopyxis panaciterrae]